MFDRQPGPAPNDTPAPPPRRVTAGAEIGQALDLIETAPAAPFDAVTRLTCRMLRTPVSVITVIDEAQERQVFKSDVGLPAPWRQNRQSALTSSICVLVKRSGEPLVVCDTASDPRLRHVEPLENLAVAAYLGVPFHDGDGRVLGALCAVDDRPRDWRAGDLETIGDLALAVTEEVSLRRALAASARLNDTLAVAHAALREQCRMRDALAMTFLTPEMSLEDRLSALLRGAAQVLGVERAAIARPEFDRFAPVCTYSAAGPGPGVAMPGRLVADKSLAALGADRSLAALGADRSLAALAADRALAAIVLRGQSVFALRAGQSAPGDARDMFGARPGAYIAAPLLARGTALGVLEFSAGDPRSWTEAEIAGVAMAGMLATSFLETAHQMSVGCRTGLAPQGARCRTAAALQG